MKILLVEDDEPLADMLMQHLKMQRYQVDLATDGQMGWELATAFSYDLLLLDVMLPVLDGISFCQQWRVSGDLTPILLLTALDLSTSKVTGLDAGADDYVVKPFNPDELLARIRALLRRGNPISLPVMQWGVVQLDPSSCQVTCAGHPIHLTLKEYELLELLLRNPHRIFSSSVLIDRLWSVDELPTESTVRAHVKGLRRKLTNAGAGDTIETVYGLGYRLQEEKPKNCIDTEIDTGKSDKGETRDDTSEVALTKSVKSTQLSSHAAPNSPKLVELWQLHQEKYFNRIGVLEQAIVALHQNCLTRELQQQAQQQAHTLAGSLGSFGFDQASRFAHQIEQTFKTSPKIDPNQMQQLTIWIQQLQQELHSSPPTEALDREVAIDRPLHLLIVDHNLELAETLAVEASAWNMLATVATQLHQARTVMSQVLPDLIVLNLNFPDSLQHQLDFLAELSTDRSPTPIVVLTALEDLVLLKETRHQLMTIAHLKGQRFLQKPVSFTQIMQTAKQVFTLFHSTSDIGVSRE